MLELAETFSERLHLLCILPHPDDEVYGAAGLIMDAVERGERVGLITLTRGEAGRTLGLVADASELARLRASELADAVAVLGIQHFEPLSYPDKHLLDCLDELTEVARSALRRYRPDIVLTFPPNGSNGHPDHVAAHRAVKAAWDSLEGERPQLWYYASVRPPEPEELRAAWLAPNRHHDATPFLARKLQAIACHRSQALSTVDFLRKFPQRITDETFHALQVSPQGAPMSGRLET